MNCSVCEARTDAFLCKPCLEEVERAVGDMPSLLHELSVLATGQAKVYRSSKPAGPDPEVAELDEEYAHRVAATPPHLRAKDGRITLATTRLPVNLDARDLLADAYDTLMAWASILSDDDAVSSKTVVAQLLTALPSARFREDAYQCWDEITYIHRKVESAVDRSPERFYAGPCHADTPDGRCERDLYAKPGAEAITCDGHRGDEQGCAAEHTIGERREWLLAALDDALLPLTTWQQALPRLLPDMEWPNRSTWWRWANGGQLMQHGKDRLGEPTYRGGDVIELVRENQARIVANRGKPRRSA